MIRLRRMDGSLVEIPDDSRFIELCDSNGDIAQLIFMDGNDNINIVRKEDPEAEFYVRLFKELGIRFAPIVKL